jgi:hypothetical protein
VSSVSGLREWPSCAATCVTGDTAADLHAGVAVPEIMRVPVGGERAAMHAGSDLIDKSSVCFPAKRAWLRMENIDPVQRRADIYVLRKIIDNALGDGNRRLRREQLEKLERSTSRQQLTLTKQIRFPAAY